MNNDRFKFRVWNPDWKQYDNDNYLSQDGVLVYAEVDGDGYSGLFCDGDDGVIEQCTGLKDKNGRLIYEGDVINFPDTNYYTWIAFSEKKLGFIRHPLGMDMEIEIETELIGEWEVVGNIHETKWGIESEV